MANHLKFIARTVMVQEGNVEGAYRTLNRPPAAAASPGNLLQIQILGPCPRRMESGTRESSPWTGSLRTSSDDGTMRSLVADARGKAMKPAGASTTWKWLARSTS